MPEMVLIRGRGALANLPEDGLQKLASYWLDIETFASYRINFEVKAVDEARVRSMTGGEAVELRCGKDGWVRVKDGRIIQEPPCDELLAFLFMRELLKVTPVKPDPLAITRRWTQEERDQFTPRIGRPVDMRSRSMMKRFTSMLRIIKPEETHE